MRLNDILKLNGINPNDVTVVLNKPKAPGLHRLLPSFAFERPDLFANHQRVHSFGGERTLKKRELFLSFVSIGDARMLLASCYKIEGFSEQSAAYFDENEMHKEIAELEGHSIGDECRSSNSGTRCVFDLSRDERLAKYFGKLAITRPKGQNYVRVAEKLNTEILALYEDSQLSAAAPDWREMVLSAAVIRALPQAWAAKLREWRGIYLIVDKTDGARYVGSAYGAENLLGRWRAHVAGEQGVTKYLAGRDPANFRFSVLQLLAPDAKPNDVINIEHNWMDRLHTREFGLNT